MVTTLATLRLLQVLVQLLGGSGSLEMSGKPSWPLQRPRLI